MEIRSRIRVLRNQINKNFDKELRRYNKDKVLGETLETFVNERRVLTVLLLLNARFQAIFMAQARRAALPLLSL